MQIVSIYPLEPRPCPKAIIVPPMGGGRGEGVSHLTGNLFSFATPNVLYNIFTSFFKVAHPDRCGDGRYKKSNRTEDRTER